MGVVFTNNAETTLAAAISSTSATSISVTSSSTFPTVGAGEYFYATISDGTNLEIVKITAVSGTTWTVVRASDNTTARTFANGSTVQLRTTAALLTDIQENIASKSANQTVYNATAASSATAYDVGINPGVEANAMVFLDGVMQHHDTFSFSGSTLTFDAAPVDGTKIEVIVDNLINLQSSNLTVDTFTATSNQTAFTLSDSPAAESNLIVFINGVFQNQAAYTISNNTLTLDTGVVTGRTVTVYVINPVNIGTPSDGTVTSAKLSGNITTPGTLTVGSHDVAFDSPTFVVDNANSRVGLGTASPSVPVDIVGEVKTSSHINIGGNLVKASGDLTIDAQGNDTDIIFKGTDNSSDITALTLDMSAAGAATFNSSVNATNYLISGAQGSDGQLLTSTGSGVAWEDAPASGPTFKTFGTDSIMVGDNATGTIDAANYNTGLGVDIFKVLTSGDQNTCVGTFAFEALTTGSNNTAIGLNGCRALTTGDQNTTVGSLSLRTNTTGSRNTSLGYAALNASTTASNNTAIGSEAMTSTTTGYDNVAVGRNSLDANTEGHSNTAVGESSLTTNTTGNRNVAIGQNAMSVNTTGSENVAIGRNALDANTDASSNVAIGDSSMTASTTANHNTCVGHNAGASITVGQGNTCIGADAGDGLNGSNGKWNTAVGFGALSASSAHFQNTAVGQGCLNSNTAHGNTGVGAKCLEDNTSGSSNNGFGYFALNKCTTGDDNCAFGNDALGDVTTGNKNTAMGGTSGNQITTGNNNVALGFDALTRCTTGSSNVCAGYEAGDNITSASNNVCIGIEAGTNITQGDNNVCIGNAVETSGEATANCITIGHNISAAASSTFSFGKASNVVSNTFTSNATFTRSSDLHKKTNIEDTDLGLSFINELRPVTFNWKPNNEFPKHYKDYSETENNMDTETNLYGMIAQDVEKALDKVGHKNFGGWSQEEDGSQKLAQAMFIYPLINAVKELSTQVEELKAKLEGE